MAFPTGWTRRCKLTVQHSLVPGDLVAFEILITNASLPSEMLTLAGANAAQSDGGDIRFTSDLAGASLINCEIVGWTQNANPALAKAEIWVSSNVFTGADTDIYVWYNAGGAQTQPGFGFSQATWDSGYQGVYHLANGSALSAADSTVHANDGVVHNATAGAGQIDGCALLSGTNQYIDLLNNATLQITGRITLAAWIYVTGWPNPAGAGEPFGIYEIIAKGYNASSNIVGYQLYIQNKGTNTGSGRQIFLTGESHNGAGNHSASLDVTSLLSLNTWTHVAVSYDGSAWRLYLDGAEIKVTVDATGALAVASRDVYIGAAIDSTGSVNYFFTGAIDEARISNVASSANWIQTMYNNQNNPGAFTLAGTPVTPSAGSLFRAGELGTRRGSRQVQ